MIRRRSLIHLVAGGTALWLACAAGAVDLEIVTAQRTKDMTVTLLAASDHWKPGRNGFVVAFTSADGKLVDVGKVWVSTSMAMPGMAPMLAGSTLTSEGVAGRYRGTISFDDPGERQVTVIWDGPAGKGSTKFPVQVR